MMPLAVSDVVLLALIAAIGAIFSAVAAIAGPLVTVWFLKKFNKEKEEGDEKRAALVAEVAVKAETAAERVAQVAITAATAAKLVVAVAGKAEEAAGLVAKVAEKQGADSSAVHKKLDTIEIHVNHQTQLYLQQIADGDRFRADTTKGAPTGGTDEKRAQKSQQALDEHMRGQREIDAKAELREMRETPQSVSIVNPDPVPVAVVNPDPVPGSVEDGPTEREKP